MLEKKILKKGALHKVGVQETLNKEIKTEKKYLNRKKIQDEVFDDSDSIADNAKMISLLLTVISRMYDIMPTEQKDLLKADDKAMIEYAFNKFHTTNTRADTLYAQEGNSLIDTLMKRQSDINLIIG